MKLIIAFFFFLLVCSSVAHSQNKIYLDNAVKDGKVIEITPDEIKYKNPSDTTQLDSVPRNKTLLLFNDKGGFLVFPEPDSTGLFLSENLADNFINTQNDTTINADRIFTRDKKIINCTILNEDILSFFINLNGIESKVDKSTVAAVIYKNGEHKLTADLATAVDVLKSFQMQNKLTTRLKTKSKVSKQAPSKAKVINKVDENLEKEKNEPATVNEQKQPLINTEQAMADSIAAAKQNEIKYLSLIAFANSLYKRGEYVRAKSFYLNANELKPNEREPLEGIDSINTILLALEKLKLDSAEFDAHIATADSLTNLKKWDSALVVYNKAKAIRPQDYYLIQEMKYVQSEIDMLKAKAAKIKAEAKFNDAMARANVAVKEKRYEDALAAYREALEIHPDDKYAIDRARILTYQVSLQKKNIER